MAEGGRNLRMHLNSPARHIPSKEAIKVSLDDALAEMDVFPSYEEYKGGFIGFINDNGESLQFIRFGEDSWFVDAPFVKRGDYAFSRQIEITYTTARSIVERFFQGEDLRKYFIMPQAMPRLNMRPPFFRLMLATVIGLVAILTISLLFLLSGLR